jgi:hypothetical protein
VLHELAKIEVALASRSSANLGLRERSFGVENCLGFLYHYLFFPRPDKCQLL